MTHCYDPFLHYGYGEGTCPICGKRFGKTRPGQIYCRHGCYLVSKRERDRAQWEEKHCPVCGIVFDGPSNQVYCDQNCQRNRNNSTRGERKRRRRYVLDGGTDVYTDSRHIDEECPHIAALRGLPFDSPEWDQVTPEGKEILKQLRAEYRVERAA